MKWILAKENVSQNVIIADEQFVQENYVSKKISDTAYEVDDSVFVQPGSGVSMQGDELVISTVLSDGSVSLHVYKPSIIVVS